MDMSNTTSAIAQLTGVTKTYGEGEAAVHALRGIDLALEPGEVVVVLGPSGSGKTTLLNILGGLDTASGGEAWFLDHELTGLDDAGLTQYRREHVGFVFQFFNLLEGMTVLENVTEALIQLSCSFENKCSVELVKYQIFHDQLAERKHQYLGQVT